MSLAFYCQFQPFSQFLRRRRWLDDGHHMTNLEAMDGAILNQSLSLVQWKSHLESPVTKTIKGCYWMTGLVSRELKWDLSEFGLKSRGEHYLALIEKCEENGANIWKYLDIRCSLSAQQRDILIQGVSLSALRRCPFIRGWFRLECSLCTRSVRP